MSKPKAEVNFCRRCSAPLTFKGGHRFVCQKGHDIFYDAAPATGLLLLNDHDEVLLVVRGIEPGAGALDCPGGFCDGKETLEEAVKREVKEEVGLDPEDYTEPQYVCSGVDDYDYKGETLWSLGVIFEAKLTTAKIPQAADDARSVRFIPLKDIDLDAIYFPTVKTSIAILQNRTK